MPPVVLWKRPKQLRMARLECSDFFLFSLSRVLRLPRLHFPSVSLHEQLSSTSLSNCLGQSSTLTCTLLHDFSDESVDREVLYVFVRAFKYIDLREGIKSRVLCFSCDSDQFSEGHPVFRFQFRYTYSEIRQNRQNAHLLLDNSLYYNLIASRM